MTPSAVILGIVLGIAIAIPVCIWFENNDMNPGLLNWLKKLRKRW